MSVPLQSLYTHTVNEYSKMIAQAATFLILSIGIAYSSASFSFGEKILVENSTINTCSPQDLLSVGTVHMFKVCSRPDDPIITHWLKRDLYWGFMIEYETLLAHRGPFLVVEIGGNIGINAIHAAVLGHEVLAFEPQIDLSAYIKLNARLNGVAENVTVVRMGLSDKSGTSVFKIDTRNRGGSAIADSSEEKRHFYSMVSISLTTLDDINIQKKVFLMKIDVESHELKVLLGGSQFFNSVYKPEIILLEFGYPKQRPRQILELLHETYKYDVYIADYWLPGGQERHMQPWFYVHPSCYTKLVNDIHIYIDLAFVTTTFKQSFPWLTSAREAGQPALPELDYNLC